MGDTDTKKGNGFVLDISAVTGTYNRLPYLKKMVDSVRTSVGDLSYEIILVDGGSTDGTLEWCATQDDIVLIGQGELLGGIKAFNTGCEAARGRYVVILNDDIELVDDTIYKSWEYLERHPRVAQVAYRNITVGNPLHHRAVYSRSYGYLYGQCCITRRWAGDAAGWWGPESEGLHTYGGDSRLGMRLWELGFRVESLDGCAIVDYVVDDAFRRERTAYLRPDPKGPHRDTIAYRRTWDNRMPRRDDWVPAHLPALWQKALNGTLRSIRFRHARQGMMRMAQLRAFRKMGVAKHYAQNEIKDRMGVGPFQRYIAYEVKTFKPDIVLFQAHGPGTILPETVLELREEYPNTYFVNFDGDMHPQYSDFHFDMAKACDLQTVISPDLFPLYVSHGAVNIAWWFPGAEIDFLHIGKHRPANPKGPDVISLMNRTPPEKFPEAQMRIDAVKRLADSSLDFAAYGIGWHKEGVTPLGVTYNDDRASSRLYKTAKMALSISQSKDLWGYTSNRMFFAGAAGCPLLCQRFRGMEALGFVDGETVIAWTTLDEMCEKADYYLAHSKEREVIGQQCRAVVLDRHTHVHRNWALLEMLEPLKGGL